MAKREKNEEFREIGRAVGRFRAGKDLSSRQLSVLSGLFHAWVEFFIDGRQFRRERRQLKYRVWRKQESLLEVYHQLLRLGLDPCRNRWTHDWDAVITTGRRQLAEPRDWGEADWRDWA